MSCEKHRSSSGRGEKLMFFAVQNQVFCSLAVYATGLRARLGCWKTENNAHCITSKGEGATLAPSRLRVDAKGREDVANGSSPGPEVHQWNPDSRLRRWVK